MHQFQVFFQHYGLLAVMVALCLENLGLPLPGELVLLYAGYQVRVYGGFGYVELVVLGTAACVAGQAVGYAVGRYASGLANRILGPSSPRRTRFEAYFARHGKVTVLLARFVAGLRVVAGLLAGAGRMPWRPFLLFSAIGAGAWVAAMAGVGMLVGAHGAALAHRLGQLDILIVAVAAVLIVAAWRRLLHE